MNYRIIKYNPLFQKIKTSDEKNNLLRDVRKHLKYPSQTSLSRIEELIKSREHIFLYHSQRKINLEGARKVIRSYELEKMVINAVKSI